MVALTSDFLQTPLTLAHHFLASFLKPGDSAVDATVGNGRDTLFLAAQVGLSGKVFGFDVQGEALNRTRERLEAAGLAEGVELFLAGHETMSELVPEGVAVIMFNLGYLPGGNHNVVTKSQTSIPALSQGLKLLKPGGLISLVIYPGHPGGHQEAVDIESYVEGLPKSQYKVLKLKHLNRSEAAPYLVLINKNPSGEVG